MVGFAAGAVRFGVLRSGLAGNGMVRSGKD